MEIMHQPSQRRIPADIRIYINYMALILERVSCFFYNPINMVNWKALAKRISRGNKYHVAFGKRLKIRKMPQSGKGLPFPAAASFVSDSIYLVFGQDPAALPISAAAESESPSGSDTYRFFRSSAS